jgi:uncharacterized membrane protein
MKKTQKLSKEDARIFMAKLNKYPMRTRSRIESNIHRNSDGSIDILDAMLIYHLASNAYQDDSYSSHVSSFHEDCSSSYDSSHYSSHDCGGSSFDSGSSGGCDCGGGGGGCD